MGRDYSPKTVLESAISVELLSFLLVKKPKPQRNPDWATPPLMVTETPNPSKKAPDPFSWPIGILIAEIIERILR